jgi:hypothetical protein
VDALDHGYGRGIVFLAEIEADVEHGGGSLEFPALTLGVIGRCSARGAIKCEDADVGVGGRPRGLPHSGKDNGKDKHEDREVVIG